MEISKLLSDVNERLVRHTDGLVFNLDDLGRSTGLAVEQIEVEINAEIKSVKASQADLLNCVDELLAGVGEACDVMRKHIRAVHDIELGRLHDLRNSVGVTLDGHITAINKVKQAALDQVAPMPATTQLPAAMVEKGLAADFDTVMNHNKVAA